MCHVNIKQQINTKISVNHHKNIFGINVIAGAEKLSVGISTEQILLFTSGYGFVR